MRLAVWLVAAVFLTAVFISLASCATAPTLPPTIVHNGTCHPSTDLPKHKTVGKVPEQDTLMEDVFSLLGKERGSRARDDRDYNSLHDQCVDPKWPGSEQ